MKELIIESPCKINLHLDVGPRREDGFHPIKSIFHEIPLCDIIHLKIESEFDRHDDSTDLSSLISFKMEGGPTCPNGKNLAYRAALLFFEKTGIRAKISILLEKGIPSGAGLGGGSSNAATVLKGLNQLFALPLTQAELMTMGAILGSDVPFFIMGGAANVEGRGEILTPLPVIKNLNIIIIKPMVEVSTVEAYQLLDEKEAYSKELSNRYLECYKVNSIREWSFFNSFQQIIVDRYAIIGDVITDLKRSGALFSLMSGSGSAVFGLFETEEKMNGAYLILKQKYSQIWQKKRL